MSLLEEGSVVWVALPHSVVVDNISPNQKKMFYSAAIRMSNWNWNSSLLSQIQTFVFRACFCILVYLCVNLILSVLFYIKQIPCLPPMICLCRYGTGQRPLLPYEPHLSVDITSSGESSSGFTSQDSTMERCKTGTSPCCITTVIINIFFINSGSHDHSFIVIKSCHLTPQFPSALWSFSVF